MTKELTQKEIEQNIIKDAVKVNPLQCFECECYIKNENNLSEMICYNFKQGGSNFYRPESKDYSCILEFQNKLKEARTHESKFSYANRIIEYNSLLKNKQ
jgi:hypothetical protein